MFSYHDTNVKIIINEIMITRGRYFVHSNIYLKNSYFVWVVH